MNMSEYASHDGLGLTALVRGREVTSNELAALAQRAIDSVQGRLNAVAETWLPEEGDGKQGDFAGVPFLIKDIAVHMKGRKTEFGSRLTEGLVAPADSFLMRRFREAGLVTIGRTVTPEMAFSSTTESVFNGPTHNPWDLSRSVGGSSGGSAAAVACGAVPLAHGTDGGGSLRIPASFCGLFALKPSRGRVSNGPHLDEVFNGLAAQLGLSRSVRDSAALLDAVQGDEPGEPYGIAAPKRPYLTEVGSDPKPLRIGLQIEAPSGAKPNAEVARATQEAARLCESLGHSVVETPLPLGVTWDAFVHANAQIWCGNLVSWIDDFAAAFGREVSTDFLERSTLACYHYGKGVSADAFTRALALRNLVARAAGAYFKEIDIVLSPTMPAVAQPLGTYESRLEPGFDGLDWPRTIFEHTPYTAGFNIAGLPAMSVPLGTDAKTSLPIGIQFGAAMGREDILFQLAGQLERAAPWAGRKPALWVGSAA